MALTPVSDLVLQQAEAAERARQLAIKGQWACYYGQFEPALKVAKGKPDDNVKLNFARLIVDKGVGFLFGKDVGFVVDRERQDAPAPETGPQTKADVAEPGEGEGEGEGEEAPPKIMSPAQQWLDAFWKQNRKMTTLHKLGVNGGVTGHVFVKLQPDPDLPCPRLIVWDTQNVSVVTDPDDYERVLEYRYTWTGIDPYTGKPQTRRQIITRGDGDADASWAIVDQVSKGDSRTWVDLARTPWPYPWAPVFQCQNLPAPNEFYGCSDLEQDILGINKSINFVLSNMSRILRFHAHPKTVGTGMDVSKMVIGIDDTIGIPAGASLANLEMESDLGSSLQMYRALKEALHEEARLPEVATGKVENLGQLSGLALSILYGPLVEKSDTKELLYGDMLVDLCGRALEWAGVPLQDGAEVAVRWPERVPVDKTAQANTAIVLDQLGVSRDTLLRELEYDPAEEARKKAREQTAEAKLGADLLARYERGQGEGGPGGQGGPGGPGGGQGNDGE